MSSPPPPPQAPLPTAPIREEHAWLRARLSELLDRIGSLPADAPEDRRRAMKEVVRFLSEHVRGHADWEDRVLYSLVDRLIGGPVPFTLSMRREHETIRRWHGALAGEAANRRSDGRHFVRKADQLVGLIIGHMECEEEILFPILDRSMTIEEFEREVLREGRPGG